MLWNTTVHHRAHNSLPLVAILSQINPVYTLSLCTFKTRFNIIFSCTSRCFSWYPSFRFPNQNSVCFLFSLRPDIPTRLALLSLVTRTTLYEEHKMATVIIMCLFSAGSCYYPPPPLVQISSSVASCRTPSVYILPSMRETEFQTHVTLAGLL
jgi:hypothetical protein